MFSYRALSYDERSQVPIVLNVNNEDFGVIKNQRFKIIKLDAFNITIKDDQGNKHKLKSTNFKDNLILLTPQRSPQQPRHEQR